MGAVDFRSDKERIARYTKQTRNATRALVDQQSDELEEFREFQQWKADREAAQQRQDRVVREEERTSAVARKERARRERDQASPEYVTPKPENPKPGSPANVERPWGEKAADVVAHIAVWTILTFIVLEIAGIRLGWWWASIGVMFVGCVSWRQLLL